MTVQVGGGFGNVGATVYLTGAVTLNNISTFFDVVSTATLPPGTYLISGNGIVRDTVSAANVVLQVTDGTNIYASSTVATAAASAEMNWSFSAVVTITTAVAIKLQARDITSTNGQALNTSAVTGAVANKATYITSVRLY